MAGFEVPGDNGEAGYFGGLVEKEIDYKAEAAVIATIRQPWAEAFCRCGIWTKGYGRPKNSGRCHHHSFCRLCSWLDHGKLIMGSFGAVTRTFHRAVGRGLQFLAVHLSVRDNPANARAIGRDLTDDDLRILKSDDGLYSELYQSRPVYIDGTDGNDDLPGLWTCQHVSLACSTALRDVYKRGLIVGVKSKLETAIQLCPTRALPHAHAIVTASASMDAQTLAEELKGVMDRVLQECCDRLHLPLFASVRVYAIRSAGHLEKAAMYTEKVIPLGILVRQALSRPDARRSDGRFDEAYLSRLEHGLENLHDQIDSISKGFQAIGGELGTVRGRLTLGNLRFGKKSILDEPASHRRYRTKKAAKQRAKRKAKRKANR